MLKAVPIAVSLLALVVSSASLYLSYLSFLRGSLPPVVSTRLNEFELTSGPIAVSANFDFSVSNHSSEPIFIVRCEVTTDGLNGGGGGYGEHFSPCGLPEFEASGGLELAPGQTEFFSVLHEQALDSYDPRLALEIMGIELAEIEAQLEEGSCFARIFVSRTGGGMHQNCSLLQSVEDGFPDRTPNQRVFELVLQTGTGELLRSPIYLSSFQPWPWGN